MATHDQLNDPRLVSVITIFLNAASFLEEAVRSTLSQTHANWELLLVDDGSTDGSTATALRFAREYPTRVRYLEHPGHQNRGMSASRNLGIRHANGSFVAFLDADDVWLPQKLERQLDVFDLYPEAQMVYGPSRFWYSWTGRPEDGPKDDWKSTGVQPNTLFKPPELFVRFLRGRAPTPATCSVLMRREAIEAVGGFEEQFRGLYEDQAFFSKVFLTAPIYVSGESWDLYRQHPDSCCYVSVSSGSFDFEMPNPAQFAFLQWLERYLETNGVDNPDILNALSRQLWLYRHPRTHRLLRRLQILPNRAANFYWNQIVPSAFRLGRRLIPVGIRQGLWNMFLAHRTKNNSHPRPFPDSYVRFDPNETTRR